MKNAGVCAGVLILPTPTNLKAEAVSDVAKGHSLASATGALAGCNPQAPIPS